MKPPVIQPIARSKKFWIITTIIVVGIVGFFIMNLPAQGLVAKVTTGAKSNNDTTGAFDQARQLVIDQTKQADNQATGAVGSSIFTGKYFSLNYPNTLTIKNQDIAGTAFVEKIMLLDTGSTAKKVLATATRMPDVRALEDVSAVQVRKLNPKRYSEREASASGTWGLRFDKQENGYEAIVFILKKQILYVLSLTAPSVTPDLDPLFTSLLNSFTLQ